MKISHLKIYDFNQFQNFTLDLTYPDGHEKAGQPLDKVCFLGGNSTGKTSLLKVIMDGAIQSFGNQPGIKHVDKILRKARAANTETDITPCNADVTVLDAGKSMLVWMPATVDIERNRVLETIFVPETSLRKAINTPFGDNEYTLEEKIKKSYYAFQIISEENIQEFWNNIILINLLRTIQREKFEHDESNLDKSKRDLINIFNQSHPDPIDVLASVWNPLLNAVGLYLDVDDISFPQLMDDNLLMYIKNSKTQKPVPYHSLSSGIRNLLFRLGHLKIMDMRMDLGGAAIFVDEPETSLYPDIHAATIQQYLSLAPSAQFFFATHSPIIASAFEPWEIVELKFNEEGFVYQEPYYTGERHVDNYTIDPRVLRWDQVLTRVFDMQEEGNMEFRLPKLMEVAELEAELKYLKEHNGSPEAKRQKWAAFKKAAELMDWDLNQPEYAQD